MTITTQLVIEVVIACLLAFAVVHIAFVKKRPDILTLIIRCGIVGLLATLTVLFTDVLVAYLVNVKSFVSVIGYATMLLVILFGVIILSNIRMILSVKTKSSEINKSGRFVLSSVIAFLFVGSITSYIHKPFDYDTVTPNRYEGRLIYAEIELNEETETVSKIMPQFLAADAYLAYQALYDISTKTSDELEDISVALTDAQHSVNVQRTLFYVTTISIAALLGITIPFGVYKKNEVSK